MKPVMPEDVTEVIRTAFDLDESPSPLTSLLGLVHDGDPKHLYYALECIERAVGHQLAGHFFSQISSGQLKCEDLTIMHIVDHINDPSEQAA